MASIAAFIKNLFLKPIPPALSAPALEVLATLYAHENAVMGLPPGKQNDLVKATCKDLHKALDNLRKHHKKPMPPQKTVQVLGGPGTKDDDDDQP